MASDAPAYHLPIAKIKKIMMIDPAVKRVGKDATVAAGGALEAFLRLLASRALEVAQQSGRKGIQMRDFLTTIYQFDDFEFLRDTFPLPEDFDFVRAKASRAKRPSAGKTESERPSKTRKIDSIFKPKGISSSASSSAASSSQQAAAAALAPETPAAAPAPAPASAAAE